MMAIKLEVFENQTEVGPSLRISPDQSSFEDAKLIAYESGYKAGWEDAASSKEDDQNQLTLELARHIQMLTFTYHEARSHILQGVEPLLQEIITRLLPEIAREALGPTALELLMPALRRAVDVPIILVVNPESRQAVEKVFTKELGISLEIIDEPSLGEGQIYMRMGETETQIDLERAANSIISAIRNFFELAIKDTSHE